MEWHGGDVETGDDHVLDNQGVDAGLPELPYLSFDFGKFFFLEQCVECDVYARVEEVGVSAYFFDIFYAVASRGTGSE